MSFLVYFNEINTSSRAKANSKTEHSAKKNPPTGYLERKRVEEGRKTTKVIKGGLQHCYPQDFVAAVRVPKCKFAQLWVLRLQQSAPEIGFPEVCTLLE